MMGHKASFIGGALATLAFSSTAHAGTASSSHHVSLDQDTVVVVSTWQGDGMLDEAVSLAWPLPAKTQLDGGAEPVRDDFGRVVAFTPSSSRARFTTRLPLTQVASQGYLPVAIPSGPALHCVHVDQALRFSPDAELGLVAHLGHHAPVGVDERERRDLRWTLGARDCPPGSYYVRGSDVDRAGGFVGSTQSAADWRRRVALLMATTLALVVLVLVIASRRLSRAAEYERAEELLEAEFAELDDSRES
jgi:hypothetical protein